MSSTQYTSLNTFLKEHALTGNTKDDERPITHTRIGDIRSGSQSSDSKSTIYPGKYHIPDDKTEQFHKLYIDHVFVKKKPEYLTEVQLKGMNSDSDKEVGSILVDFDFRYGTDVTVRQHTQDHITEIIELYFEKISELIDIKQGDKIPVYIFEKESVNITKEVTKDGIHMIIGLKMDHILQQMLRTKILESLMDEDLNVFVDLELTNNNNNVLDEGITKGCVNWQMYGSQKPGNMPYKLVYMCNMIYVDSDDSKFLHETAKIPKKMSFDLFKRISARNRNNKSYPIRKGIDVEYESKISQKTTTKRTRRPNKLSKNIRIIKSTTDITDFKSIEELDATIEEVIEDKIARTGDNKYREIHQYIQILGEEYYEAGSYDKWLRVGMAAHSLDEELGFLSWVRMSAKMKTFDFTSVPDLYKSWNGFIEKPATNELTFRSIIYWAKKSNPEEYQKIKTSNIDYYIIKSLKGMCDTDIAIIMYQLYKDAYACASYKHNLWYKYVEHRWKENELGVDLRRELSSGLHRLYVKKAEQTANFIGTISEDDKELIEKQKDFAFKYSSIGSKLKTCSNKNNYMKECQELFHEPKFVEAMDQNPMLVCFNNGVYDFEQKEFRDGKPEDFISKSTNIDYIEYDEENPDHIQIMKEIEIFMSQLFPNKNLKRYMYEHLASTLRGDNKNQTFNLYIGKGRNGKSKLVEFMTVCLGEYKGTVPINLITQKRTNIGGTSSEVACLRGTRYAVMQEPSKTDTINEGILKELTGGDPIQARALWKDSITFVPQFNLAVCSNTLPIINSNDDGTWRRIRVVNFESKFTETPRDDDEDYPHQFKVDLDVDKKFDRWKNLFMWKLIQIVNETDGRVTDCEEVTRESKAYRNDQDAVSAFIGEKLRPCADKKIKKMALMEEFKKWYNQQYGNKNVPKGKEVYEAVTKKYGKFKNGWHNVEIIYEEDDDDEIDGI